MSAREELIRLIAGGESCGGHYNCGPGKEDLRDAEIALDDFIHELAEQQRAWARKDGGAEEYGSYQNVLDAADLIDPKVQR